MQELSHVPPEGCTVNSPPSKHQHIDMGMSGNTKSCVWLWMGDLLQALGLPGALWVQERCWYLLPPRSLRVWHMRLLRWRML